MDSGQILAILPLDLSAAFDTVNHTVQLETFEKKKFIELQRKLCHGLTPSLQGFFILLSRQKYVKKSNYIYTIAVCDNSIKKSESVRYLGEYLDKKKSKFPRTCYKKMLNSHGKFYENNRNTSICFL